MRQTCLNMVHQLAQEDDRVVFIGSDLGKGVLQDMKETLPDRFFMEGVSEQNIIGMAAGMAMDGYLPYVNTIATFLTRRCFEQVAIDLCLHRLPVRLIGNGGGVVYAPLGPTHMAIEDIAIMRALPNMTVVAPSDAHEMTRLMLATVDWPDPIYIRVAKGGDAVISRQELGFEIGRAVTLRPAGDVAFVSTGVMSTRALAAAEMLAGEGIDAGVLHMHTIKPLDVDAVQALAGTASLIVTVEEHTLNGGLGSAVVDTLVDHFPGRLPAILRLGIPDCFTENYGSQEALLAHFGLAPEPMAAAVRTALGPDARKKLAV